MILLYIVKVGKRDMNEFINKYLTKKVRTIGSIVVIVLGLFFVYNYCFNEPTYINKMIAARLYRDDPPHDAFHDINFYNCVLDKLEVAHTTILTDEQLASITELTCSDMDITDVSGLEKMINLATLDLSNNNISSVNLANNTKLTSLNLSNNNLTTADTSDLLLLTTLDLSHNRITSNKFNIRSNGNLVNLDASYNQINTVDISYNQALTNVNLSNNTFWSLDDIIDQGTYNVIPKIKELDLSNNNLSSDSIGALTKYTALTDLDLSNNNLTTVDVTGNKKLVSLHIDGERGSTKSKLNSLNVSGITTLKIISVDNNELTTLNVSSSTAAVSLSARNNQLTSLTLNTKITELYVSENKLTSLSVPASVQSLNVANNELTTITFAASATALTNVDLSNNKLTTLNISKIKGLKELNVSNNRGLTAITTHTTNYTSLTKIDASNCSLTALTVNSYINLVSLNLDHNNLATLNVAKNTKLTDLVISNNNFTKLDYVYVGNELTPTFSDLVLPTGKTLTLDSVAASKTEANSDHLSIGAQTISADMAGEYSLVATYRQPLNENTNTNTFTVSLTVDAIGVTDIDKAKGYVISNAGAYIYTATDVTDAEIKGNIDLGSDAVEIKTTTTKVNGVNTPGTLSVYVKGSTTPLKTFDILNIRLKSANSAYSLTTRTSDEKYIYYVGNQDDISSAIAPLNVKLVTADNKLLVKTDDETETTLDTFILAGVSSKVDGNNNNLIDLNKAAKYIYYTEYGNRKVNDLLNDINTTNTVLSIADNKLVIKYKNADGPVLSTYDLLGVSSTAFDLSKPYAYYGEISELAIINAIHLSVSSRVKLTISKDTTSKLPNKLSIALTSADGKTTYETKTITLVGFKATKTAYKVVADHLYVANDYNLATLANNFTFSVKVTKTIDDTDADAKKLQIRYADTLVAEYQLMGISSDSTDLTKSYIYYTASGNMTINDVSNRVNPIGTFLSISNNKLHVKYPEDSTDDLATYDLVGISSEKYDLSKDFIYYGIDSIDDVVAAISASGDVKVNKPASGNKLSITSLDGKIVYENKGLIGIKITNYTTRGNTIYVSTDYGNTSAILGNITLIPTTNYDSSKKIEKTINSDKLVITYAGVVAHEYELSKKIDYLQFEHSDWYTTINQNLLITDFSKKASDVLNNVTSSTTVNIYDKEDNLVDDTVVLKTGYILRAMFSATDLTNKIEYSLSLKGDVLGEGTVTKNGICEVAKQVISSNHLSGPYLLAADSDSDGNVRINDVVNMLKKIN